MFLETIFQDLRIGFRVLVKEKSFCFLAIFVLALGIGAVTTQYAVVNGAILRGFSFPAAERLVDVQLADPEKFDPDNFNSRMTTADFVELKEQQKSFEDFVGYLNGSTVNLTFNGNPQRYAGGYVTWDFFRALGVSPVLGRDFLQEEDRPNIDKAVILSDALWRRDFGASADVIGKAVRVNGRAGTIIGVMPPKFHFPQNEQLWLPVNTEFPVRERNDRGINFISAIARLKPGVSYEQAESELSAIARGFAERYPDTNKQFTKGYVRPLISSFTGQLSVLLYTMLAFCVGVLLIACVNVMNMQFARAVLRAKELAIRSSLGATRLRLIRQMLTESLLLSTLGALLGIGLAFWSTDYLDAYFHRDPQTGIPAWMIFSIDGRVIGIVLGATLLSAVVSGFVPAWMASRTNANDALKEGGRGNTSRAVAVITKGLVVFQIVVTCILLIGSGVMVQSIIRQQTINYGYDTGAVFASRMGLMEGDYPTNERRLTFYQKLLRELRVAPQFEAVAYTSRLYRNGGAPNGPFEIEGREYKADTDRANAFFENISPGFFTVLGVKLLEGRDFTDNDSDQKLPVAIVNATFARKLAPDGGSALGRRFRTINQNGTQPGPWRVVVGVVPDVRQQGPFNNNRLADASGFFVPFFDTAFGPTASEPQAFQFGTAIVRPHGDQRADGLLSAVQQAVRKVDPNLPLYFNGTPKSDYERLLGPARMIAAMFGLFGLIAIVLASVGLYGVMSFSVNQRSQEFGVRMALGADAPRILRMVFRQGTWQIVAGLVLGLGLALGIASAFNEPLTNFLFETSPRDPLTYLIVSALVAVVALIAILIPARRATRVDPMTALRAE